MSEGSEEQKQNIKSKLGQYFSAEDYYNGFCAFLDEDGKISIKLLADDEDHEPTLINMIAKELYNKDNPLVKDNREYGRMTVGVGKKNKREMFERCKEELKKRIKVKCWKEGETYIYIELGSIDTQKQDRTIRSLLNFLDAVKDSRNEKNIKYLIMANAENGEELRKEGESNKGFDENQFKKWIETLTSTNRDDELTNNKKMGPEEFERSLNLAKNKVEFILENKSNFEGKISDFMTILKEQLSNEEKISLIPKFKKVIFRIEMLQSITDEKKILEALRNDNITEDFQKYDYYRVVSNLNGTYIFNMIV